MHANGDIERGYPPVLPLASRGALVGATPLLVTGTPGACDDSLAACVNVNTTDATTGATALLLPAQNTRERVLTYR